MVKRFLITAQMPAVLRAVSVTAVHYAVRGFAQAGVADPTHYQAIIIRIAIMIKQ